MSYLGDYVLGATVYVPFNTTTALGASTDLSTDGTVVVYKSGSTTEITGAFITVTEAHDGDTGTHLVAIDTGASALFTPGSDYSVKLRGSTIASQAVNAWVRTFSIRNRYVPGLIFRGFAQASPNLTSIKLPATSGFATGVIVGATIIAVDGPGAGTSRLVDAYDGPNDLATVREIPTLFTDETFIEVFGTPLGSTSAANRVIADVWGWKGTTVPDPHTAGYPVTTDKVGTGPGEKQLSGGVIRADDRDGNLIGANVMTRLGTPSGASVSSDIAGATVAASSAATAAGAAATAATSADTAATNILTQTVTGTFNVKECFDAMMAVLAGAVTVSDAPGGQKIIVFRDVTNARNALTVVADGTTGARGSVTFNLVP